MAQLWAPQEDGWRIMVSQRSEFAAGSRAQAAPAADAEYPAVLRSERSARGADGGSDRAAKEHKRVIVMFGANWCYDCHVLDTTLHSKEFAPLLEANYVLVHINIGEGRKGQQRPGGRARRGPESGDSQPGGCSSRMGGGVFAQKDGEFESTVKIGPEDVRCVPGEVEAG